MILMLLSGSIFYTTVEGWHWIDSLYFCVVTLATIGYGDLAPKTVFGKVFTMIYIFGGLGLFIALIKDLTDGMVTRRSTSARKKNEAGDE